MGRSAPVRSAPGFRSRPPLPSRPVSPGRDCRFFLRLRHDSVRRFANLPNGDAGSLQSVRSACLSVRSVRRSVRPSARLSGRFARFGRFVFPSVWFVSPPVRPSARPPIRPVPVCSARPPVCPFVRLFRLLCLSVCQLCLIPVYPFIHSARPFCPPICPPIRPVPSASSLRLLALSDSRLFLYPLRSSRPPALTFLSAPPATCLPALRLSAHSCLSAPSALSALPACPVRLSARPAPEPPNFIPPISHSALFFRRRMFFSHPISDTLLKSRRGELGISDNN